jgi:hypothetical protein
MGLVNHLSNFFTQTVIIEPHAGVDDFGENSFGAAVSHKARIVGKPTVIRTMSGEEKVSGTTIYIGTPNASIKGQDRLTLPSGYTPQQPQILSIARYPDRYGEESVTVYT